MAPGLLASSAAARSAGSYSSQQLYPGRVSGPHALSVLLCVYVVRTTTYVRSSLQGSFGRAAVTPAMTRAERAGLWTSTAVPVTPAACGFAILARTCCMRIEPKERKKPAPFALPMVEWQLFGAEPCIVLSLSLPSLTLLTSIITTIPYHTTERQSSAAMANCITAP